MAGGVDQMAIGQGRNTLFGIPTEVELVCASATLDDNRKEPLREPFIFRQAGLSSNRSTRRP